MSLSELTFDLPVTTADWLVLIGLLSVIWIALFIGAGPTVATIGAVVGLAGYGVDRHTYIGLAVLTVGILLCISRAADRSLCRPRYVLRQMLLVLVGFVLYEYGREITEGPRDLAVSNSLRVLDLEQRLSLHIEPRLQGWVLESDQAISLATRLYSSLYLPFIIGTLFWFLTVHRFPFKVLRNTLAVSAVLGLLTWWLFPVAPPRMIPEANQVDLHDHVGRTHGFINEFAAVPSFHVGWTVLCSFVIASWYKDRRWSRLAWIPAILMVFIVIVTGNHYWVDGAVGALYVLVPGVLMFHWPVISKWWRTWISPREFRPHDTMYESVRASNWALLTWISLGGLLAFLLVWQFVNPGFTDYWGYMVAQITMTLLAVGVLTHAFAREGGLSWITHLIIIMVTYADTLGTAADFYDRFTFYDKITHVSGGMVLSATAFEVLQALQIRGAVSLSLPWRAIISTSFAIFMGALWEFYEIFGDAIFDTGRHAGSTDTTYDLISDSAGAILAVALLVALEPFRSVVPKTASMRTASVKSTAAASENA